MKQDVFSRQDLVRRFREEYPAEHALWLGLGGCRVEVRTNSETLLDELVEYFAPFLTDRCDRDILITAHQSPVWNLPVCYTEKEPEPGKTKIKEEYADLRDGRIVRKKLTGMVFVFGGGDNLAIGPCTANPNQVVNFVNNRFIEWRLNRGGLLGHAAGITHRGVGLALAGFSGMGKSTLALKLMSRGTTFVSNDRLIVTQGLGGPRMIGVAKHPRINPGTALNNPDLACVIDPADKERFERLPAEALWDLEHKYDALIEECFGAERFVLSAAMHGLAILNWRRGETGFSVHRVDPRKRPDLLSAFRKETGLFFLPENGYAEPGPERYAKFLSQVAVLEISGGIDFDRAADHCLDFLQTGTL
ncbi:MAG: HprK-related kinase B [Desulfovibrionales bacterium]